MDQATATRAWQGHVRNTPPGMVPVIINGAVFAYQVAMGTDFTSQTIGRWFESVPKRFRPAWLEEVEA